MRFLVMAAAAATAGALMLPTRPIKAVQAARPTIVRPAALACAWMPSVALADDFGSWVEGLGTQDYVSLGVLAFLLIFVIPSLVTDMIDTQRDPAAAIEKKQQKLIDLEAKYNRFVGDAPAPTTAAEAPANDALSARRAARNAEAKDEADALLASVKAMTGEVTPGSTRDRFGG
jgi:hypothetical protein